MARNLPAKATTKLPATYEAAKKAIAELDRIDECAKWADTAKAIAAYAKMAADDELLYKAHRIKARATRRMGELLSEVEPSKGGGSPSTRAASGPSGRKAAGDAAGISERQRKTALRIASIPKDKFDELVEDKIFLPTISYLSYCAALGKRPEKPRPPSLHWYTDELKKPKPDASPGPVSEAAILAKSKDLQHSFARHIVNASADILNLNEIKTVIARRGLRLGLTREFQEALVTIMRIAEKFSGDTGVKSLRQIAAEGHCIEGERQAAASWTENNTAVR